MDQEIQAFLQPIKQAATTSNLAASQENLSKFLVTPVWIYTKLASLSNPVTQKKETLNPNALECLHQLKEEIPLISPIAADYHAWKKFLKGQQVNSPELKVACTSS